ncbi:PREDICTED: leucine-rich repeat-containing protein 75A-like [Cyprinodon variegatus]|uniref:leucine-rich repeat-containing protein 75A-like n=1 Tax=Cyprinodon variegatus TaxID=28743 RepID=UPI000742A5F2|nr:PREDICTED: leucine-rich repeat-containing protein 75A-like [Cyprinodon variegatus]
MGAKQTKGQEPAGASPQHSWKRTPTKERGGDILASLMLKSGDRLNRGGTPPPPYQRRIGMIQEMMMMAKQGKQDEATEMLKTLRQDLGMESTSLDDVLYRYASFRNLPGPIRPLPQDGRRFSGSDGEGLPSADLPSQPPLSVEETRAAQEETSGLDPSSFPSVTWIDLGNNVDIFSLPQPFLVSLRKRCPKQGNLPTILEFGESQASEPPERPRGLGEDEETDDTNLTESLGELRSEVEGEMDGETEIEEMMEELLDFDREIQGKEDEEESMWTLGEQRRATVRSRRAQQEEEEEEENIRKEQRRRPRRKAVMAEDEDDTQSRSSHMSFSSQSQHSLAAAEPIRVEEEDLTDQSEPLT